MVHVITVLCHQQEHFYQMDKTERKEDPYLHIEIWDDDKFSRNDFIGTKCGLHKLLLALSLTYVCMYIPSDSTCVFPTYALNMHIRRIFVHPFSIGSVDFNLSSIQASDRRTNKQCHCNLFTAKRVKGWWPVYAHEGEESTVSEGFLK